MPRPAAKPSKKQEKILALRRDIDRIDDKILALLQERAAIVKTVGKTKNLGNSKKSIICPGREANMVRRMVEKSEAPLSEVAVALMWRLIISSSIFIEEKTAVSVLATHDNKECYWLARECFGAFTPLQQQPTSTEIIKDIIEQKATVGVLPMWDEEAPRPWWVRMTEANDPPMVFAKLPFIKLAPSTRAMLVAIGYITPEPSGKDESLWVIQADETIPPEMIEEKLKQHLKVPFQFQDDYRLLGNPTMRYNLLKVMDFVNDENAVIPMALEEANRDSIKSTPITAHYLGSYATPLDFVKQTGASKA